MRRRNEVVVKRMMCSQKIAPSLEGLGEAVYKKYMP